MTQMIPVDPAGGVQARWQAALNDGRFLIQRCGACSKAVFFPRELCPHCGSGELSFVAPSGEGVVYAVTTVRRKPEAGGDYNVSLIDLAEGVRMMSRIEGVSPADVRIGQRVTLRVVVKEGVGMAVFDPVTEGATA
jgi:uncharacterized OB-fold protein